MSISGEDGKKSCSREPPMFNGSVVKWHKKKLNKIHRNVKTIMDKQLRKQLQIEKYLNKILLILVLTSFLTSCNNKQTKIDSIKLKADTLIKETASQTSKTASDSVSKKADKFFNDESRDINNFTSKIYNELFDNLNIQFTNNKQAQTSIKNNLCGGDYCLSYKILTDNQSKSTLYLFKADCGEYGFSNDQFLITNDSLVSVRNFKIEIQEFSTETSPTIWSIEENIYQFNKSTVTIKSRKKQVKDILNYDWKKETMPFNSQTIGKSDICKTKKEQLRKLIETKNLD